MGKKRTQNKCNTNHVDGEDDIITSKLGYWTDNSAYYYGAGWHGSPNNLSLL